MAINLRMTDSYDKFCIYMRSHIRRCGKVKGADGLLAKIKAVYDKFRGKKTQVEAVEEEVEDAFDNADFQTEELDNALRDLAGRAKEFDRKNPGAGLNSKFFPDGLNDVIRANREKEPDMVDQIAIIIESLGSGHELFPFAAQLREETQKTRDTNKAYNESVKKLNNIKTEFDIIKSECITQYGHNILEAKGEFGNDFAERLFLKPRSSDPGKDNPPNNNKSEEKKAEPELIAK